MRSDAASGRWRRLISAAVVGAAFLSAFGTTGAAAADAAAPGAATPVPTPAVGDTFPAFEAVGIDGETKKIDFPKGSKTVLLFFLSGCPVCHKMIPEWNRAYGDKPKDLNVYGILMDKEPPGFFIVTPIAFPVLRSPGRAFLDNVKVFRAPMMVRVGAGGKIEDAAMGQIDRIRLSQIFK